MLEARHRGRWTQLDNVWRNANTTSMILSCEVQSNLWPANTDHLPIITMLDLNYYPTRSGTHFNFKKVEWDNFEKSVKEELENSPLLNSPTLNLPQDLEQAVEELFKILHKATTGRVPVIKPQFHLKHWWTKSLSELRRQKNKASAKHFKWRGLP